MRRITSLLLLLFFFSYLKVDAQETTSEIQGLITDDNALPLHGATIKAVHMPTGTVYTTTSRKDGRYNLPNVRIGGPYNITVSFIGFKTDSQNDATLLLGQEFNADFALKPEVGQLRELVVTTTRHDKVFNNSHTGSQEIINPTQIERLPTVNRSLQDAVKLVPSSNGMNIGGRNNLYNNMTVDGANFNNAFGLSSVLGGQTSSQPISLDAIEQVQVSLSPYDVRQGGFSGAGINSVTRSGTNKFKGSVYTYIRTPGLQGYNVKTQKVPRTDFNYNMRGFSIGGPIIQNKLFFFLSGEQERITTPGTSFVASDASHQPGGNVSLANADTLNALRSFLKSKYNYDPGAFQGYNYRTQSDKVTAKIDWNVNGKNTLTIKYNYLKSFKDQPPSTSGAPGSTRGPNNTAMPFSGSGYTINNNFNIFIVELNSRFSNRATNKFQLGYTALRDFRSSLAGADFPLVDIMNGQGQTYTSFGYEPFTYHNLLNSDIYQLSDIFTMYKSSHEITIGSQNYYKKFKNGFAPNYEGLYRFNTLTDFYNSANNGVANSVLYNLQYSAEKGGAFPFAKIGSLELGFFLQDKWRLKRNFTLTYGLRIDAPIFQDKFDHNQYVPALTFRDGKHYDVGQKPGTNLLFSPRVGFNWDVLPSHKLQIRGGAGLFSGPPPFVWISNQASNNGVQFGSFSSNTPYAFNHDINAYRPANVADNVAYNLVFTDKKFKYPQVAKGSIGFDYRLPGDFVLTVEGVYSKEINAVYFQNVNLPSTGTTFQGSDNRIRYSATKIYSGAGGATVTNPNISNAILMTNSNEGYSGFATIQIQKAMRNLLLSASYTYSRAKTLNDGGSIASSMWRDRPVTGDPNAEQLGFPNFYLPHRVLAYASYKIEYAKYFASSIGLVFEAAPSGSGSFTYNGDVNNDGTGGNNDLIYIPKNQNDIVLVPVNTGGGTVTDTRTPAQIWGQLNNFISQDAYLSNHRGQYAQRNAVVFPWFKRMDLNVTQDFYMKTGKDKHTLRVTFDVINFGNMLNKNWGAYKIFTSGSTFYPVISSFLKYEGVVSPANPTPRYSFPYLDPANQVPLTSTYKDDPSILSRWQAQIGIRYLFN